MADEDRLSSIECYRRMNVIALTEAKSRPWDIIIAGTSFAAMFFARYLPAFVGERAQILFVEKGPLRPHATQIAERRIGDRESIAQRDHTMRNKPWIAHTMFGGNSNCWWACTPRFHPDDFRLRSRHGIGTDWPIGYGELEPFYSMVEEAMDVSGGGSDHILPRSRPFPSPPHAPSLTDIALRRHSRDWFAMPTARSTGRTRAKCCANGVCHLCPIDSKYTILNDLPAMDRANHYYLLETEARAVTIVNRRATTLLARQTGGAEAEIKAELFALGTNAVSNAAILIRSGVVNRHLGAHLHEQVGQSVDIDIDHPNYFGGTSITGHGYGLYAGEHRQAMAAVLLENSNSPPIVRRSAGKWTHCMRVKLIAEDLPQARNRVILVDDEPLIEWHGHHPYAYGGLKHAMELLPRTIPFQIERMQVLSPDPTESHILGTTRMGSSANDGVIDGAMRTFAASNVLVLGAGAFPSCAPANPTLTLAALSARAAASL